MLFNSYIFVLLFLPVTLFIYFLFNHFGCHKMSIIFLAAASFVFYSYNSVKLAWVLVISVTGNFFLATIIKHCLQKQIRKLVLIAGILANSGSIFYFKYLNFVLANLNTLFEKDFIMKNIVLPLGISFYTFQQISFLIDTYRGETSDYSFWEYTAFVSFFPQLVAGPIVLHSEIIPQFRDKAKWRFNHDNFANGIYVFTIGLSKKVLLADLFGSAVTWGWATIDTLSSMEIIIVMLSYTFQIYFDFSGYSDMAVGLGKMFNIEIPVNFLSPYKSYSILEFWKRWHITLTRFLRNYVYIPLGGNKKGYARTYVNIILVFLLSGVWHGANWTFILWGVLHGLAQVLNRFFEKTWNNCNPVFRWLCTFSFINIMWLLFRADSVMQAMILMKRMFVMDSLTIRAELYNCFFYALPELGWIAQHFNFLSYLTAHITGFYMWTALVVAVFMCLNLNNLHDKEFKPTWPKSLCTPVLLIWSIVSLGNMTTFLYFNF